MTLKEEMLKDLKRKVQRQHDQIIAQWYLIAVLTLAVVILLGC